MSSFFIAIFLGLLILVTIAMLVVFYYVRKGIRFFRRFSSGEMTEEDFQRMANKYYYKERERKQNGESQFDDDYFKGNPNGWRKKRQQQTARTTRTADGITIVDNREPSEVNKKIFAQDEGEYVDFKEN